MPIGIANLSIYIPNLLIPLDKIAERYQSKSDNISKRFNRAIKKTGQISIRFPNTWEDSVTMAAQAAKQLLDKLDTKTISKLRYIAVGTETSTDLSKPIAAHVNGLLNLAGFPIPKNIATFQTQHACASGTFSLLGVNALLSLSNDKDEYGLVICTDIAKYAVGSTAEITQGAGAIAMLVGTNSKLVSLNFSNIGYSSTDVDDFFRPVGAKNPSVKGRFSIECYKNSLEEAFIDYSKRSHLLPEVILNQTDIFVFHSPYYQLPLETLQSILTRHLNISEKTVNERLTKCSFQSSIQPASIIGNLYSGSIFLALAGVLNNRYKTQNQSIIGQKILFFSYGSGNTAIVIEGTVGCSAPQIIGDWNFDYNINQTELAKIEDYERWIHSDNIVSYNLREENLIPVNAFYLQDIREDGYRIYALKH